MNIREDSGFRRILFTVIVIIFFTVLFCVSFAETHKHGWTLTQYPDASGNQGMFYTLKNHETGTLIVIDGGSDKNTDQVRHAIKNNGGIVHAWFITHFHSDHVDAFNNIYEDPDGIIIEQVYAPHLDKSVFYKSLRDWDTPESFEKFLAVTKGKDNRKWLKRGNHLEISGLNIDIFNSYDKKILKYGVSDIANNCSLIIKITGENNSILFCGDAHAGKLATWLMKKYGKKLKSEFVQAGHHGNNSFPEAFYGYVDPKIVLFDAPAWLMTSEDYSSKDLKKYCDENGIKTYDFRSGINRFSFS